MPGTALKRSNSRYRPQDVGAAPTIPNDKVDEIFKNYKNYCRMKELKLFDFGYYSSAVRQKAIKGDQLFQDGSYPASKIILN